MTTVLQVLPLPEATTENAAPLFDSRPSQDTDGPFGPSTGYRYWSHNLPQDTIVAPDSGVAFPDATAPGQTGQTGSSQLPGPGPVVWLTVPGTYLINVVMAWTAPMQPKMTGVTGPTVDDVPHDLKICMVAVTGTNPTKPTWGPNVAPEVSTVATLNTLTPRIMAVGPDGTVTKWIPNYVTQSCMLVLTVPPGSFGAMRIQSAASILFSRLPIPVLYSMEIVELTAVGGAAAAAASSPTGTITTSSVAFLVPVIVFSVVIFIALVMAGVALSRK